MNIQAHDIIHDNHIANRNVGCRLCGSALRHSFVDLGMSPPCESFLQSDQLDQMEPYYPLNVHVCDTCYLVQLTEYISPESISAITPTSPPSHQLGCACQGVLRGDRQAARTREGKPGGRTASNDGYLLQHFRPLGVPVLGIEPAANVARAAEEKGVTTRVDFFGVRLASQMVAEGLNADLIIGNNVLAQVPDLNDFVAGMNILLKPEGVITLEFPHVERLMAENQFDTIYHEHFSYFSLLTINHMAGRHGLRLIDVEELPTHGGSLRVYLAHEGSSWTVEDSVTELLDRENRHGLTEMSTYASFRPQGAAGRNATCLRS
jgi:hypothetical protein